jgi:hypothetical protein
MDDFDVFVYCGGKCGSMTLYKTLENNGYNACHTHGDTYWLINLKKNTSVFDCMDKSAECKKIYIIDSYRTPIERCISSFFQNIEDFLPSYKDLTITEIINWYDDNEMYLFENYHPINQALIHYNLPLFDKFDFDKRYVQIEKDNKVFIKLLFSDINYWDKILGEIFEKPIKIYSDNLTSNKNIYNLYNEFKKIYKIPKHYIDNHLIQTKEFKIYNTPEEQKSAVPFP